MTLLFEDDTEFRRIGVANSNPFRELSNVSPESLIHDFGNEEESLKRSMKWWGNIVATKESISSSYLFLAVFLIIFVFASITLIFLLTNFHESSKPSEIFSENHSNIEDKILSSKKYIEQIVTFGGFSCRGHSNIVISENYRCDGVADCHDGSDEVGCQECKTSFSCPYSNGSINKLCLRSHQLCNNNVQCYDSSDETFCQAQCSTNMCSDSSMCFPQSFVCDGEFHCPFGDDEKGCKGECKNESKWCKALNKCLPKWQLCDGIKDCQDGTDEEECDIRQCSGSEKYLCRIPDENKGYCIKRIQICNGISDCPNNLDEKDCFGMPKYGNTRTVKCNDGNFYSKIYACSGMIPACNGICDECDKQLSFDCGKNHCILKAKVCDGIQDCPNGSDEKSCNCTWSSSCPVLLPNGKLKCIEPSQICNGFIDCPAGEDENNCMKCSADSAFKCKNQTKCIPPTAKCDGRNDCLDGSDEEDCTSDECAIHPFPMYLCSNRRNCVRKTEACSPFSTCPNRTVDDERYCSNFLDSEVFKTIL